MFIMLVVLKVIVEVFELKLSIVLILLLAVLLMSCEADQPSMIVLKIDSSGSVIGGNTTYIYNNFTNNITNNITNSIYFNQTYNRSVSCANSDNYIYNLTELNGVWTASCDPDNTGGAGDGNNYPINISFGGNVLTMSRNGLADLTAILSNGAIKLSSLNLSDAPWSNMTDVVIQNTSTWLAINTRTLYPGISNFTLANFQTQNNSDWSAINTKAVPGICAAGQFVNQTTTSGVLCQTPSGVDTNDTIAVNNLILRVNDINATMLGKGISNFTLGQFQTQNTTIWSAINNGGISNFTLANFQVQNTSLWLSINSKALLFANSSVQCSGTDKLSNITSLNGLTTGICTADQTGAGGAVNYGILVDQVRNITGTTRSSVCGSTDKVKNVSIYNGVISTTCETDQTGGGSPASYSLLSSIVNITDLDSSHRGYLCNYNEFDSSLTNLPFTGIANVTGTVASTEPNQHYPGVVELRASATAGSGYGYSTSASGLLLNTSESAQFIFNVTQPLGVNLTHLIAGYTDNLVASENIVDGVFMHCRFNSTTQFNMCHATARNNGVEINNSVTTSLNYSVWYHLNISTYQPSNEYTLWANFTLYNASGFVFWNVNISQGIPSSYGRSLGVGFWAWRRTAGIAATSLVQIDYMEYCTKRDYYR
jgi:hypothetical protein